MLLNERSVPGGARDVGCLELKRQMISASWRMDIKSGISCEGVDQERHKSPDGDGKILNLWRPGRSRAWSALDLTLYQPWREPGFGARSDRSR